MNTAVQTTSLAVKRCPECSVPNPVANRRCTACQQVLGSPDKNGIARRPVAWGNYFKALFWMGALSWYLQWAFFK